MTEQPDIGGEIGRLPRSRTVIVGLPSQQELDLRESARKLDRHPGALVRIETSEERDAGMRAPDDVSTIEIDRVRQQIERVDPHADHALELCTEVRSGATEQKRPPLAP